MPSLPEIDIEPDPQSASPTAGLSLAHFLPRHGEASMTAARDPARNRLLHIADRRLDAVRRDLVCPDCGAAVVAKRGDINRWHFAHKSETDGAEGERRRSCAEGETALHAVAKAIVASAAEMSLPCRRVVEMRENPAYRANSCAPEERDRHIDLCDAHDGEHWVPVQASGSKPAAVTSWPRIAIRRVALEENVGGFKPDAVVETCDDHGDGRKLYLEMAVSHSVGPEKAEKLVGSPVAMVEVQLDVRRAVDVVGPNLGTNSSYVEISDANGRLRDYVLHDAPREWLWSPMAAGRQIELARRADGVVADREAYLAACRERDRAIAERQAEQERAAAEQQRLHNAPIAHAYLEALANKEPDRDTALLETLGPIIDPVRDAMASFGIAPDLSCLEGVAPFLRVPPDWLLPAIYATDWPRRTAEIPALIRSLVGQGILKREAACPLDPETICAFAEPAIDRDDLPTMRLAIEELVDACCASFKKRGWASPLRIDDSDLPILSVEWCETIFDREVRRAEEWRKIFQAVSERGYSLRKGGVVVEAGAIGREAVEDLPPRVRLALSDLCADHDPGVASLIAVIEEGWEVLDGQGVPLAQTFLERADAAFEKDLRALLRKQDAEAERMHQALTAFSPAAQAGLRARIDGLPMSAFQRAKGLPKEGLRDLVLRKARATLQDLTAGAERLEGKAELWGEVSKIATGFRALKAFSEGVDCALHGLDFRLDVCERSVLGHPGKAREMVTRAASTQARARWLLATLRKACESRYEPAVFLRAELEWSGDDPERRVLRNRVTRGISYPDVRPATEGLPPRKFELDARATLNEEFGIDLTRWISNFRRLSPSAAVKFKCCA